MGSLSLQLVPLVGMPNKDASKNREGDGSLALGGHRWVVRHNNQPIAVAAIGGMMERMLGRGGVYWGGIRSRNQGDIDGTSRIVLPCPSS